MVKTEVETEVETEEATTPVTTTDGLTTTAPVTITGDVTTTPPVTTTEVEAEVKFDWSRDPEEYKNQLYRELAGKAIIYPIESVAPFVPKTQLNFSFILALDVSPEAQHNEAIDKSKYKTYTWVVADLTSSFMIMIGIFFPSGGISN